MYAALVNPIRKTMYTAAVGVTLFGAAHASTAYAQERMASTEFSDRATYLEKQCAHIKDHADAAGCYAGKAVEYEKARAAAARQEAMEARERAVVANKAIAKEEDLAACLAFLKGKKNSGTAFDRPITRDNACAFARQLGMGSG